MAINVLQGKPGAGKSYNAVQRVIDALEDGRVVVTNLPVKVNNPKLASFVESGALVVYQAGDAMPVPGEALPPTFANWKGWAPAFEDNSPWSRTVQAKDGSTSKVGPLLIVDEASNTLAPMIRNSKGRGAGVEFHKLIEKLATHRHYAIDVIFLYQDHTQINPQVKALVERFHNFTNTSEATAPLNTWSMKTTARGFATGNAQALATSKGRFLPEVYELYDSHAEGSGRGESVKLNRKGLLKSRPLWLRWWFIVLVVALVALPVFLIKTWNSVQKVSSAQGIDAKGFALGGSAPGKQTIGGQPINPLPAAPVPGSLPGQAIPPIQAGPLAQVLVDGAPKDGAVIVGFGRSTVYFADGNESTVSDIVAGGWRIVSVSPCRVVVVHVLPRVDMRTWRCVKGF